MRVYVQNAYGVLIVPDLLKGGFIVGGQYGTGVMLARDVQTGLWGEPAFFDVYGGSLGLQVGGQTMDAVFTLMNQGAIDKLLSARFKIGADASGCLGPIGSGVGAGHHGAFRRGRLRLLPQQGPVRRPLARRHRDRAQERVERRLLRPACLARPRS